MTERNIPFRPIRDGLYTSAELSAGFDPNEPKSLAEMADFRTFRYFVINGRATPEHPYAGMMEALHDNSILQAMFAFLGGRNRIAAIMGGHREIRGSANYRNVAILGKRLSEAGFLMASGGGPGAMEATHLGALLKGEPDTSLDEAIKILATAATLPHNAANVVREDGTVDDGIVRSLHEWSAPAHQFMGLRQNKGESLAVPTWHYGHEPVTPLASHAAKYFQNSVREDVLLYLAAQGIVFAPGRAGTLQEVFQDAAQNYYPSQGAGFAPMVFYDADEFWTRTLPVAPLLEGLFKLGGKEKEEAYRQNVLFSADLDVIIEFLQARAPSQEEMHLRAKKLGMLPLLEAQAERKQAVIRVPEAVEVSHLLASRFVAGDAELGILWSADRHRVIGEVADQLLTAAARRAVAEALGHVGSSTLGEVADWADQLRGAAVPKDAETTAFLANSANRAEHPRWHYLNLPFGTERYDEIVLQPFIPGDGAHVVAIVQRCAAALVTPTARLSRTNALRWLTHLVGDLHQPMHLGCGYLDESVEPPRLVGDPALARELTSDRGGNNLLLPTPLEGTNLHSYWDGVLSSVTLPQVKAAAEAMSSPQVTAATLPLLVSEWVNETLTVCRDAYWSVRIIGRNGADRRKMVVEFASGLEAYERRNAVHVHRQMARAAVRLAAIVKALLPQ